MSEHSNPCRGDTEGLCIVLVGDSLVGKTSFLRRIRDDTSDMTQIPPVTVGTNLFDVKISVDGAESRLEMWDTAGQERYRSIVPMYYRRADAVMVFFDLTNRASFLHAREWVSEARHYGHRISRVALIGNKTDLLGPRRHERAASEAEVRQFVTTFDLLYAEMSVRQDENVQAALEQVVRETLETRGTRRRSKLSTSVKVEPPAGARRLCCR